MKRKHRQIGSRIQLLVEEMLHRLGHHSSCVDAAPTYQLQMTRLEERVLMSASPAAVVADVLTADAAESLTTLDAASPDGDFAVLVPSADGGDALQVTPQVSTDIVASGDVSISTLFDNDTTQNPQHVAVAVGPELIVIDYRVQDADTLLSSLLNSDRDVRLLRLTAGDDGVQQITEKLEQLGNVSAIHLLTHGSDAEILLGSTVLNASTLAQHAPEFLAWQHNLTANADLLIYGCDVAATPEGRDFVASLANLTEADVAASADTTGSTEFGGNWDLEFSTGQLETPAVFTADVQQNWFGKLAVINVTTFQDVVDGNVSSVSNLLANKGSDGFISLREAILAVNAGAGGDTINLTAGTYTLAITGVGEDAAASGDLDIRKTMTIFGTGSGNSIINANGIDRVFHVLGANGQLTLMNLTVQGGNAGSGAGGGLLVATGANQLTLNSVVVSGNFAANGAGIDNAGTLSLMDVTISNNGNQVSTSQGGGLRNTANASLNRVTLSGNQADSGGGIYNNFGTGNLTLTNITVSGNTAASTGGGLYTSDPVTIINSTFTQNTSDSGGGIRTQSAGAIVSLKNTIVAGNIGTTANPDLSGTFLSSGNNLIGNGTGQSNLVNGVNGDKVGTSGTPINPSLGSLQGNGGKTNTHALLAGSSAINAGTATGSPTTDQRDVSRVGQIDIGAYEYVPTFAQTGELTVNETTGQSQQTSGQSRGSTQSVSITPSGNYVVVWTSNQSTGSDTNGRGVLMRTFRPDGTPLTGEIQVNQTTNIDQQWATVSTDDAGNGVVVWTSTAQDNGSSTGVYARRFSSTGALVGNEFLVNTTTAEAQENAVVDMSGSGAFVVTWSGNGTGDTGGIFYRRFDANGTPLNATERLANATNRGVELTPSIAMNDAGQFAITWQVGGDVFVRNFAANGNASTADVQVDSSLINAYGAVVGIDATGRTVVVYRSDDFLIFPGGVWGRSFNADGTERQSNTSVATGIGSNFTSPSIATDDTGNFIVTYQGSGDGSGNAVFVKRYDADFNALGITQQVNTTTAGNQQMSSVAMLNPNNYVVVWSGQRPGDSDGVFARQFSVVDVAPVITSNGGGTTASINVVENSTAVTTVTATDADLPVQPLTYSISGGADSGKFTIGSTTGTLSFVNSPDFENPSDAGGNNVYDVTVQVSDGTLIDTQAIAVTVTNSSTGDVLIAAKDTYIVSGAATLNYGGSTSLVLDRSGGGLGNGRILLQFDLSDIPAGASITSASLVMQSTQNGSPLELNVYQVSQAWDEGTGNGTPGSSNWNTRQPGVNWTSGGGAYLSPIVATLNTGAVGQHTWNITTLVSDWYEGNAVNNGLMLASPSTGTTTVTYDSTEGAIAPRLVVTFDTTNAPPAISSNGGGPTASINITENTTSVTTVQASDINLPSQTLTYTISGGADAGKFTIDSSTGVLRFVSAPNFEAPTDVGLNNVYEVTVRVSDGSLTDIQTISVTVANTNDTAPVVTSGQTFVVAEFAANGTSLGSVTATDADGSTTFSGWAITAGNTGGVFAINATTGVITVADRTNLNFDITPSYLLSVTVSDGVNTSTAQTITVNATDSPNTAPVANNDSYTVLEGGTLNQTVVAGWFYSNWEYRQKLVFNNSASSTNLINNAVLVKLHTSAVDAIPIDYSATQNAGQDLRFVDRNGTVLAYEIEQWDESGYSYVWVKVPQIDAGSTTDSITMYYGNSTAAAGQNPATVWSSNNVAVFHMNTSSTDSSSNANNGSPTNVVAATGKIAGSIAFDGQGSKINAQSAASVDNIFAGDGAISAWINPVSWGEGGYGRIADKGTTTTGALGWGFQVGGTTASNGYLLFESDFTGTIGRWETAAGTISLNAWQNVVVVYDNSSVANVPKIYVNGTQLSVSVRSTPVGVARSDAAQDLTIGNRSGASDRTFNGRIDEVRFSSSSLTADQIKADYKTAAGNFVTAGNVETGPGGLLNNDVDVDGDLLTVSLVSGPARAASFTLNPDGSFTYVHDGSETTTDSFTYRVHDGSLTDTATVYLAITPVNDNDPIITSNGGGPTAAINVAENTTAVTTVIATDADLPTQTLSYSISGGADAGRFSINTSTGELRFKVAPNFESPIDAGSNNDYNFVVRVSDGSLTSTQAISVTVSDINEFPVGPISDANGSVNAVNENSAKGTVVGVTAFATDIDATTNTVTYSLDNNAGGRFAINSTTGIVTVANGLLLDRESAASHDITVRATSSDLSSTTKQFTINVLDINEFPVSPITDANNAVNAVNENVANRTVVGVTAFASDADATTNTVTYSLDDNAGGRFAINSTTGIVTVANGLLLDRESAASHDITVRATSSDLSFTTKQFTINVLDVNEFPVSGIADANGSVNAVNENAANGTTVGITAFATDADATNNTVTYSLNNNAGGRFAINSTTGVVTVANGLLLDREFAASHNIAVRATSSDTSSTTKQFSISVLDVNEAPSMLITQTVSSLPENATTTSAIDIATISLIDDTLGSNTLSLTGTDAAKFQIVSGNLRLRAGTVLDAETQTLYTVNVILRDTTPSLTPFSVQTVNLTITNIDEAPSADAGGPYTISEGDALMVVAGPSVDPEGMPLSYAWDIDGDELFNDATGSTAALNWNQLTALAIPVNDNGLRMIAVRVTDPAGNATIATSALTITNTAPTVNVSGNSTATSGVPYTISLAASDPGTDTIATYRVSWGDGITEDFAGTATSASHTYLNPGGTRSITVQAIDEDGTFAMNGGPLVVTVLNNSPSSPTLSNTVVAGLTKGATVGTLSFTDPDFGDSHTWAVSNNRFRVTGSQLTLKNGKQLDPLSEPTVTLTVTVRDASGATGVSIFNLRVNNAPVAIGNSFDVDGTQQLSVSSPSIGLLANDFDIDGDSFSASVVSGPSHAAAFGMNPDGTFWYRAATCYSGVDSFRYRLDDGTNLSAVTTVVLNVNQPGSVTYTPLLASILEHQTLTSPLQVGSFHITDDGFGANTLTLSGRDAALFSLDGSHNLFLKAGLTIDFSVYTHFEVTGLLDDPAIAGTPDASRAVVVAVQNLNDAPVGTFLADVTILEDALPGTISTASAFSDIDGDVLTYSMRLVTQTPELFKTLSIDQTTGVISYSPNPNAFGSASLRVTAKDPSNATASLNFNLIVQPVADAPIAQAYSNSTYTDQTLKVSSSGVLSSVNDPDHDFLTVTLVSGPANGTLTLQADGAFVYTPRAGFQGVDTFRFVASDGTFTSNIGTATISVLPQFVGNTPASSSGATGFGTALSATPAGTTAQTSSGASSANTGAAAGNSANSTNSTNGSTLSSNSSGQPQSGDLTLALRAPSLLDAQQNDDEFVGMLPTGEPEAAKRIATVSATGSEPALRELDSDSGRRANGISRRGDFDTAFSQLYSTNTMYSVSTASELHYRNLADYAGEQADSTFDNLEKTRTSRNRIVGSVGVVTTGFSVGYLFWAIRGGMLVSGLLAQMPAWAMLDPLLVIDDDQKEEDKESLQNIVDHQQARLNQVADAAETGPCGTSQEIHDVSDA